MPRRVLVIYSGGTIGSRPKDPDPESPQIVVRWEELAEATPEMERLGFDIDCVSTPVPLDSCNIGPDEWRFMAETIEERYDDYAGFVILHGTDTLAYTASALSFMLQNLGKPVVLTGAQRSAMVSVRNDATQNFITSLLIANPDHSGVPNIPEVVICFGNKILRGNRTVKQDTIGFDAYDSPNMQPLGEVGDQISINQSLVRPQPLGSFFVKRRLDTNVLPILIYPGIHYTDLILRQLDDENLRAVVVLCFGSGNIPTDPDFVAAFTEARRRGVVLATVAQCRQGPIELGIYETSASLVDAGFVSGNDMTLEAAQCKLMVALGDPDLQDPELPVAERRSIVERQFEKALAGERSLSTELTEFVSGSGAIVTSGAGRPRHRVRGEVVAGQFSRNNVHKALLRLRGTSVESKIGPIGLEVHLNLDPDASPDRSDPGFAGQYRKYPEAQSSLMVLDITEAFKSTVKAGSRMSFTLVLTNPDCRLSWERAELAVLVDESIHRAQWP